MQKHWKIILGIFAMIIISTAIIIPLSIYFKNPFNKPNRHGYITIYSDEDFKRCKFPGSGTESDPYLIENYVLNVVGFDNAIYIRYTTKCFVIQNCILTSPGAAIHLQGISNNGVIIRNNTLKDSYVGIDLISTSNIVAKDNLVLNNSYAGIDLDDAYNTSIVNNTILNSEYGIYLENSDNCLFENNTCSYNSGYGIIFGWYTDNCIVKNNIFAYNILSGVSIVASFDFTLIDNSFIACSLIVYIGNGNAYVTWIIENNTVNNKPLGFFRNLENVEFSESAYGQLIFIDCTGLTIENQDISFASIAITIVDCNNVLVRKNTCNYNSLSGIFVDYSENISITNNTCNFNSGYIHYEVGGSSGINIHTATDTQIINNTISNNAVGIYNCDETLIENNTISDNYYGIYMRGYYTIIQRNIINSNFYGIYNSGANYGLYTYNTFIENEGYAIKISWLNDHDNIIHHNNFIDNNLEGMDTGTAQAYDEGTNNIWYHDSSNIGNYWSDWLGSGSYALDGDANTTDLYPLSSVVVW